jgi:hypothetical protein
MGLKKVGMEAVKVGTEEEKVEIGVEEARRRRRGGEGEEESRMWSGVSGARTSWPVLPVPAWCLLADRIRRGL